MRNILYAVIGFNLLLFACRKEVQTGFEPFSEEPGISCLLVGGEAVEAKVFFSGSLDDSVLGEIPDAQVVLFENDLPVDTLVYDPVSLLFVSRYIPRPGQSYYCEMTVSDFSIVSSRTEIPPIPRVISATMLPNVNIDEENRVISRIRIVFSVLPGACRYYDAVMYERNIHREWNSEEDDTVFYQVTLAKHTDPLLLREGLPLTLFEISQISDSLVSVELNFIAVDGLGNTIYKGSHENDDIFDLSRYAPVYLSFRAVSKDYYMFVRSQYLYRESFFFEDIVGNYPPYSVYSNIENGHGIFAGYSACNLLVPVPSSFSSVTIESDSACR